MVTHATDKHGTTDTFYNFMHGATISLLVLISQLRICYTALVNAHIRYQIAIAFIICKNDAVTSDAIFTSNSLTLSG